MRLRDRIKAALEIQLIDVESVPFMQWIVSMVTAAGSRSNDLQIGFPYTIIINQLFLPIIGAEISKELEDLNDN